MHHSRPGELRDWQASERPGQAVSRPWQTGLAPALSASVPCRENGEHGTHLRPVSVELTSGPGPSTSSSNSEPVRAALTLGPGLATPTLTPGPDRWHLETLDTHTDHVCMGIPVHATNSYSSFKTLLCEAPCRTPPCTTEDLRIMPLITVQWCPSVYAGPAPAT